MSEKIVQDKIREALKGLTGKLPYKWKIQTAGQYSATIVAYIDARSLMEKLDEVVGPQNWQTKFEVIGNKLMCGLSIHCNNEWVTKWDVGTESAFDKEKGEVSDAFKRAGVHWGVGRFLYDLEMVQLQTTKTGNKGGGWYDSPEIKDINRYMNEVYMPNKGG